MFGRGVRSSLALSLLALSSIGCGSASAPPAVIQVDTKPPPASTERALPENVFALDGLGFETPSRDMAPLGAMIGRRSVVGLGESIHASGGYYQAKARVIRYLVESKGFRVIAIEAGLGDTMPVTTYLDRCEGTPEEAMTGILPVYRDLSLAELLRWACTFNRAHPDDRISLWGFDMQEPWHQMATMRRAFEALLPNDKAYIDRTLADCLGAKTTGTGVVAGKAFWDSADGRLVLSTAEQSEARRSSCLTGIGKVRLNFKSAPLDRIGDKREQAIALLALEAFEGFQKQAHLGQREPIASVGARDDAMAMVLDRLKRNFFPDKKTIVWTHNSHLAEDPSNMAPPGAEGATLGRHLRSSFGDDYFPIALIGYRVKVNWGRMAVPDPEPPTWEGDLELSLHRLGAPVLLLDLRPRGGDSFAKQVNAERIGWLQCHIEQQFAAAIFVDESPALVPVPSANSVKSE